MCHKCALGTLYKLTVQTKALIKTHNQSFWDPISLLVSLWCEAWLQEPSCKTWLQASPVKNHNRLDVADRDGAQSSTSHFILESDPRTDAFTNGTINFIGDPPALTSFRGRSPPPRANRRRIHSWAAPWDHRFVEQASRLLNEIVFSKKTACCGALVATRVVSRGYEISRFMLGVREVFYTSFLS